MYIDDTLPLDNNPFVQTRRSTVIARFESWLRSHGYQPQRDPFFPDDVQFVDFERVADLVGEYLTDRPGEQPHRRTLLKHAFEIGDVAPGWGDDGCDFVSMLQGTSCGSN